MNPARSPRRHLVFADTSGYFGAATERDDNHGAALAILTRLSRERVRIVTTLFVLAEFHALVLARLRDPRFALALLNEIETGATTITHVTADDQARARDILARHLDKRYSLTDVLSFVVMERLGISRVFTFDHNFAQYGFQLAVP